MSVFELLFLGLNILGSLVFLLFGLKLLSESLQKLAGKKMRQYLSAITSNPWKGLFTGFAVTSVLQSSSAATVMIIGFVNAGLISVADSVGLVFGANIGTTITSWLITFFGFSFKIRAIILPLIALSIPFYFSSKSNLKSAAEFIMGFSILFIGLQFLRDALPEIDPANPLLQFLSGTDNHRVFSLIVIGLIGVIVTLLIQSSTATIALTIVLLSEGFVDFEVAAALVMGENIGTTATANIAAIIANRKAKRTAFIHFLFNLGGVVLLMPFFRWAVMGIDALSDIILINADNAEIIKPALQISLFHTSFNLLNALIMINFVKQFEKISAFVYPVKTTEVTDNQLKYTDSFITPVSELSIAQASRELLIMGHVVESMFKLVPQLLLEKDDEKFKILVSLIIQKEAEADSIERQMSNYLSNLTENKLSRSGSQLVKGMMIMSNNLENMADICYKITKTIEYKNQQKAWFTQEQRNHLNQMFVLVDKTLRTMAEQITSAQETTLMDAELLEIQVNQLRNELIHQHIQDMRDGGYPVVSGNFYQQLIVYCEKIADHAFSVSQEALKCKQ